jgi:hypothetical protein
MATEYLYPNAAGDETNISDQYPASGLTLTIRPTGDNGTQELVPIPTGDHWSTVDEVTEDTADHVKTTSTTYVTDRYDLADHTTESGAISNVTVSAYCIRAAGNNGYIKLGVRIGSTDYGMIEQTLATSPAGGTVKSQSFDLNPATTAAWTWAEIDALIAVVSMHSNGTAYTYQLWVTVTYGTAHWDKVDEESADGDTTYVYVGNSLNLYDLYNLPAHTGSGTINFIKVYIVAKKVSDAGTNAYALTYVKTGGTPYTGGSNALTIGYVSYSTQYNTNPQTGVAWTWDDIDALQIGVRLNTGLTNARCTQVYVEVDYTPGETPKTSSDAGTGIDAYVSLETGEVKSSSDTGSGAEGTPVPSALLASSETGSGIEALIARLLSALDTGGGVEAGGVEIGSLLQDLFASELGWGSDSLIAKIEMPTKGGGMKLWT